MVKEQGIALVGNPTEVCKELSYYEMLCKKLDIQPTIHIMHRLKKLGL